MYGDARTRGVQIETAVRTYHLIVSKRLVGCIMYITSDSVPMPDPEAKFGGRWEVFYWDRDPPPPSFPATARPFDFLGMGVVMNAPIDTASNFVIFHTKQSVSPLPDILLSYPD